MAIFYTDTGSIGKLEVSSSSHTPLKIIGSGSAILSITGSTGGLIQIGDVSATGELLTISSGSIDILTIDSTQLMTVSGTIYTIAPVSESAVASFEGNVNDYLELYVQNLNSGVSASTDIVAYSNTGTATSSFIDMGINSSGVAIGYSFGNANDAYVYNTGGHLYIGNNTAFFQPATTEQSLFLFANASGSPDMAISGGRVGIRKTGSLNATLDVSGSVSITGSLSATQGITGSISGTSSFATNIPNNLKTARFEIGVSSTTTITTGAKGRKTVPYSGSIIGWKLVSDLSTTTTVDIWKANNAIPTVANSITGSAPISLTAAQLNTSTTLTGWTTAILPNDVFILYVNSNNNAEYIALELDILLS